MRVWAVALTALVLAMPTGAHAAQPRPAPLSGLNVYTGDGGGRLDVTLTRDAVLDLTSEESAGTWSPNALRVKGAAKGFTGFVLAEKGADDGFLAVALQTPDPIRAGDRVHRALAYGQLAQQDRTGDEEATCVRCPIPAGDYELFLLGRKGTRVTLLIEGISGTSRLAAERDISPWSSGGEPYEFDTAVFGGGGHGTYMASSVDEQGLFISTYALAIDAATPTVVRAEDCHGSGETEDCSDHLLTGNGGAVGGLHVLQDVAIDDGVHAEMTYDIVGSGHVTANSDLLWLPFTESRHNQLPMPQRAVHSTAFVR